MKLYLLIVPTGCAWKTRPAQLVIHYENGFTLLEAGTGCRTLWRYPFDKLKNSSDDGQRLLFLDFGDENNVVSMNIIDCECTSNNFFLHLLL